MGVAWITPTRFLSGWILVDSYSVGELKPVVASMSKRVMLRQTLYSDMVTFGWTACASLRYTLTKRQAR